MKKLIDEHYVLLNSNIINRQINNEIVSKRTNMGETWHTDSRIIGASTMQPKISYIIVTMLEDFTKYNASTEYVESSHLADLKSINKLLKIKIKLNNLQENLDQWQYLTLDCFTKGEFQQMLVDGAYTLITDHGL